MEFHISRSARDRYQFDKGLFSTNGNVIFANFHATRSFAQKMNQQRDLTLHPEQAIRAGQINAMGLIDEILHYIIAKYREQFNPQVMEAALDWLYLKLGKQTTLAAITEFTHRFPPVAVYKGKTSTNDYLEGKTQLPTGKVSNLAIELEEMLMLWLANENTAFSPYIELFDDSQLANHSTYLEIVSQLRDFFDNQPFFGPDDQNLVEMLRSPAIAVPFSLSGQLEYIRSRWGYLLGDYLLRLLISLDFIKEEEKAIFGGPGPTRVYDFTGLEFESERFSPDRDWMPNLVLMAKNAYVWLDQLSKKYQRSLTRLDEIPAEELERLSRWGFTGLWLIGVWQRSQASRRIKQLRGNPDAEASAYSLFDYSVASDLGGEEAHQHLRDLAWKYGIRLASDMVPNHMGIDSRWVIEHPDWFVSLDYSPFPSYTFNGPNLSWDARTGLFLEDHYYNNSDAAVVFKRVDFWTGQERYIYHGNDGTAMPWNDTAQLNYLMPEVREAVIQTILSVARRYPIIRFDAAMTLAKRHYQRLWYPEPGSGGDIPSRAEHGMTHEHFNLLFPKEFWRQVVDRVAEEVPDTLLLAEAFWLMEGYFVRTLGMHRVYNSAFMNMLRDEKNQEYRLVIKNTLEFDPEILKRYVNFMNNPDERTTVDQFGKGDKYFGICTLMATMPGLPMFGHGQIEGFTEKYGMEYRRAYRDEQTDIALVERHEREIFPLLRRRYLFAEVDQFLLYDFFSTNGSVNEDVFAYSNQAGNERGLVIYHNRYAQAKGWIRTSAAYRLKIGNGEEDTIRQKTLGEGLGLHKDPDMYTIFRDHISNLEYLRNNQELHDKGLYIELEAYKYHVFLDFREVRDNSKNHYRQLYEQLQSKGTQSIDHALKKLVLKPLHAAFQELVNPGQFQWLIDHRLRASQKGVAYFTNQVKELAPVLDETEKKLVSLLHQIASFSGREDDGHILAKEIRQDIGNLLSLPGIMTSKTRSKRLLAARKYLIQAPKGASFTSNPLSHGDAYFWSLALGWLITHKLGKFHLQAGDSSTYFGMTSRLWFDEWLLAPQQMETMNNMGVTHELSLRGVRIIRLLHHHADWYQSLDLHANQVNANAVHIVKEWLADWEVRDFLGVNQYEGIQWFNQEAFDEWLWWMYLVITIFSPEEISKPSRNSYFDIIDRIRQAVACSGFQIEKLLGGLLATSA
jgi:glycosidase